MRSFDQVDGAGDASEGSAGRRVHRRAAGVATGHLPAGPRSCARRRSGGRRDHQAAGAAVFRAPGEHLRTAGREGPRQRLPVRRNDRSDPEGIITAGHDNKTARMVSIRQHEKINTARSARCSGRSSPTIARVAGARSNGKAREGLVTGPRPIPPGVAARRRESLRREQGPRVLPRELRATPMAHPYGGRAVTVAASGDLVPYLPVWSNVGLAQSWSSKPAPPNAVLGELFATEAMRRKMAGIVVYGLCCDTATLAQLPLPIYALGTIPRAAGPTVLRAGRASTSGRCRGPPRRHPRWATTTGSWCQRRGADAALETAEAIQRRDGAIRSAIHKGPSLFEQLNFTEHPREQH